MPTKELAIMPGLRLRVAVSIEVVMPSGKALHVNTYDSPSAVIVGEDGAGAAVDSIGREIREVLDTLTFGVRGRS
ncbi:hypothetical protein [Solidesulfovibrio sp.]